jgi:hypothetical protein
MKKRSRCFRCETLERPQQSKSIYLLKNDLGEMVPLCAVCLVEVKEEEDYLESLKETIEEDELGSEDFDKQFGEGDELEDIRY